MSPIWGRLATAITTLLAFNACSAAFSIPNCASGTSLTSCLAARSVVTHQVKETNPFPGTKPLFGIHEGTLDVKRRDCLSNASNYCGSGCCSSDEVCSGSKCVELSVTVTSTIVQTLTKIATQRAVVVVAEIETSTTVSTVDVTLSTAATQTNVVWVTSTAVVKRTAASPGLLPLLPTPSLPAGRPQPFDSIRKRLSHLLRGATPIPRQATQAAAPTVTSYVTHTTDITSVSSVIVTTHTTSTYVTTVYQTNTHVLKAETTITITSTLTVTSQPPLTVTLTTTANLNNPTTTPLPSPTSISSPGLPTATIAGIAAGSSTLALFLAGLTIFCLRRHNHSPTSSSSSTSSNKQTYNPMSHRHPTLPHFATTTAPAHHAAEFRLPHAYSAYPYYTSYQDINPQYPPKAGTGQQDQGQWKMGHHQRNSSGVTTLVGSPVAGTFAVAGGGYKGKKEGEDDLKEEEQQEGYGSGLGGERFELDGEGAVVRELDGEGVPKRS